MTKYLNHKLLLFLIFILGLSVRLYGLNWDQGHHLHPDERFLTMFVNDINLPFSVKQYLSVDSPLNPYNYDQYKFFVYGTFPTTLVAFVSSILNLKSYFYVNLVGRALSALFDSLNIISLFYFFKLILNNSKKVLIPSLLYALAVLPIQLSHYFAVDTFLNTFMFATFTLLLYWFYHKKVIYLILASIFYGLAISSKISAVFFAPIILFIFLFHLWKTKKLTPTLSAGLIFGLISFITTRLASPYYFSSLFRPNPEFISSLKTLSSFNNQYFPPAVQWLSKTKFVFPFLNLVLWSLGIPLSLVFVFSLFKPPKLKNIPIFLSTIWIAYLFIFQSSQFNYPQRYYLVIFPSLIVFISYLLIHFSPNLISLFFIFHLLYLVAFLNIYHLPHSRIQASQWIYQNIPQYSILSCEHWDDCLPLPIENQTINHQTISLDLYNQDTFDKWPQIYQNLSQIDYVIMSSNRLWGSIPKGANIYPQTSLFYQQLFNGQPLLDSNISFTKIAQFNNYPGFYLPLLKNCYYFGISDYPGINNKWFEADPSCLYPGIYLRDDTSDESFTVYDHPQVLVFKKNENIK